MLDHKLLWNDFCWTFTKNLDCVKFVNIAALLDYLGLSISQGLDYGQERDKKTVQNQFNFGIQI